MDDRLRKRLKKLDDQISCLEKAEHEFLSLDAHKKVLAAQLFLKAPGKSNAEKEANVYSSKDWVDFCEGIVRTETEFNMQKRKYELQLKAFEAEYLTYKIEAQAIKRAV